MTLAEYLAKHGISLSEFARRIGAHNARTVQRYTKHGRLPSGRLMIAIQRETAGAVHWPDASGAEAE